MCSQADEHGRNLRSHQLEMLRMLHLVDSICQRSNIPYQLFSGTALGAVRHSGFVPWDDDLDIVMLRGDYERFLEAASAELPAPYLLQKEFSEHWPMHFTKIRKDGTACIEKYRPKDPLTNQGIYIDIFPCDNLSSRPLKRVLQFLASKLVIAHSLDQRGYLTDSPAKKLLMLFSRIVPTKLLHKYVIDRGALDSKMVHTFFGASSKYRKSVYPRSWFTESVQVPFEDGTFPVSVNAEDLLTTLYGDWRRIPTEREKQKKKHCVLVDLSQSYSAYLDYQQNMTIEQYSESIR